MTAEEMSRAWICHPENMRRSESSAAARLRLKERCISIYQQLARRPELIDINLVTIFKLLVVDEKLPWPLFLYGPAGTGKSCAALCLCDITDSRYEIFAELCASLILAHRGRLCCEGPTGALIWPSTIWSRINQAGLYVLDELGARARVTDFQFETLKHVLDCRMNRPTIYISNLSLERMVQIYDDRIVSRLQAGIVFEMGGPDRRVHI